MMEYMGEFPLRKQRKRRIYPKICVGFGEFEGKCENKAGCPHTRYWCVRCNKLRMDSISNSLEGIISDFEKKKQVK